MFVYAHIASAIEAVRLDVSRYKDEMGSIPGEVYSHSTRPLRRGVEITVVPTCQGVTFNPQQVTFKWIEDWQQTKFRFQAAQGLQGSAGNGEITLYAGPIIIATLKIALLFESEEQISPNARGTNQAHITTSAYNQIFVSYSHADTPVVLACRNAYKALGMQVLIDRDTLRSGERWNEALMKMIENADIFQLFWSKHSSCSEYVRQEWQHALQVSKGESFIRPVYWEIPLVHPPAELSTCHFAFIQLPKIKTSDYWYILKHNFTWHFSKFFGRRT
jgi:hypothetical protein